MTRPSESPRISGVRPEAQLLLAVARTCEEVERTVQIRSLLREPFDWHYLLDCAQHNRMLPLLYWRLASACPEAVPETTLKQLEDHFRRSSVYNMRLTGELVELLRLLRANGIAAFPLKGPILAFSLYGNLALRQFWDVDIMVHKEDVLRVKRILLARGYQPRFEKSPEEEKTHLDKNSEYVFDRASDDMHVEIHWRALPESYSKGFDTDRLWERLAPASLGGEATQTLPPEDLLLFLCVHGGDKHLWHRLKWICDVARLVAVHKNMDWDATLSRAGELKRERTVFLGLFLAEVLLDAPIPPSLSKEIQKDSLIGALAALVRGRLFREGHGLPGFAEWLVYMKLAELHAVPARPPATIPESNIPFPGRLRYLFRYLRAVTRPESGDLETMPLPPLLSFIYYLWRPIRLFSKRGGALVGRLRLI